MRQCRLVHPNNLNSYGVLFGGYLLLWVDEISWTAASLDYPGCRFVTVGMDRVAFRKSVKNGDLLEFETTLAQRGVTSVTYLVEVKSKNLETGDVADVFDTRVTLVRVDESGNKTPLPE